MSEHFPRDLALKAAKLARSGLKGKEMGEKLKVPTDHANQLAALGARYMAIETAALTDSELMLIRVLAGIELENLTRGQASSPKGKHVSWRVRKSDGWAASVARKRLDTHRAGEDDRYRGTGLNLVHASRNGHMWLRPAGWALAHILGPAERGAL